ncbi:MAG TPA: PHB depolymerase family esterase [Thermoanaerobaculia bacterium]|nr:PHB depolymerase family esterase [Thermoanaerobaculia bacterium]
MLKPSFVILHRSLAILGVLAVLAATPSRADVQRGWDTIQLPGTGSYTINYVPLGLDLSTPAPMIVFLHGYGSGPNTWQQTTHIGQIAEELGFVLVMPRAAVNLDFGEGADDAVVDEAIEATAARLPIDRRRIGLSGFSAGAAYALVLAYTTPNAFNGVFAMAGPYRVIVHLQDPKTPPPARLLYGTLDPNYPLSYLAWQQMLGRLGVPVQSEIVPGLPHQVPPDDSLRAGFHFLLDQPRPTCVPSATAMCLRDRFRVEATWQSASAQGTAGVVQLTHESGYLWFFDAANAEVNLKLLDGCVPNGRYWVFAAGTTDVGVTLTVTDTVTGQAKSYFSPRGAPFQPILDTGAFATCP